MNARCVTFHFYFICGSFPLPVAMRSQRYSLNNFSELEIKKERYALSASICGSITEQMIQN
jgi:hypothetical protein